MKPDSQEQDPADLMMPLPTQEQKDAQERTTPHDSVHETAVAAAVEKAQGAPDPSASPDPAPIAAMAPPQGQGGILPTGITSPAATVPMMADDTDLIEKEWVEKAKQIVAHTSQDPYTQTKELNKLKSDYLKKRYNKDLKLSDE
ncbi:MAG TPA: hypothetical protein VK694_07440 [Verrucomicrobiae bacterium]|nr:hypothetical protein [Verrucomicrobiae bacterium]